MTVPSARNVRLTALACGAFALGMVGVAFASVPLYDLFCKATGFDGTPIVGTGPSARLADDAVDVRFDVNVQPGLPWRFAPEVPRVKVRLGETQTVFFKVTNTAPTPITGLAAFNIQPPLAGGYFVKIQCFCFSEQTLAAGEAVDFPVVFYVDPALREDINTKALTEITLSYTYFAAKGSRPIAAAEARPNL